MKKILLCVFILLVSVNVFAADVDIEQLTEKANNGDAEAQFQLGDSYYYGEGVVKDEKEGINWYAKAANQGHAEAQFELGICYWGGFGVDQDYNQTAYWWQKAAEQWHPLAQFNLGLYYYTKSVPQDYKLAYMWIYLSLEHATDEELKDVGSDTLEEFELNMTPAEIAEAEQMADEWMERHK